MKYCSSINYISCEHIIVISFSLSLSFPRGGRLYMVQYFTAQRIMYRYVIVVACVCVCMFTFRVSVIYMFSFLFPCNMRDARSRMRVFKNGVLKTNLRKASSSVDLCVRTWLKNILNLLHYFLCLGNVVVLHS